MALVLTSNQFCNLITGELLQVNAALSDLFFILGGVDQAWRLRDTRRLPPILRHRSDTFLPFIAFDLTNGGKRPERIQQVLVEVRARDVGFQPFDGSMMVV